MVQQEQLHNRPGKLRPIEMKNCLIMLFVLGIIAAGCRSEKVKVSESSLIIDKNDSLINVNNGLYVYNGKLFSGKLEENYPDGNQKYVAEYLNGKKNGQEIIWYNSGQVYTVRFYKNGLKDSLNIGFWPNGNKKFEYEFTNGNYDGAFKEWYENGNISVWLNYKKGEEDDSQKGWRDNGKLYINYVVKNGKAYGVIKSRLCYSVKNGQGLY